MKSEANRQRALVYLEELGGTRTHGEWIQLFAKILIFLLGRYYAED